MELRRVTISVEPAVSHPLYYDWGAGILGVWIFSESDDDAIDRTKSILSHLPYEIVPGGIGIRDSGESNPSTVAEFRAAEAIAQKIGFAMFLEATAPSTDPDQEGDDPPLEVP